jgi:hypothetical protein
MYGAGVIWDSRGSACLSEMERALSVNKTSLAGRKRCPRAIPEYIVTIKKIEIRAQLSIDIFTRLK